MFKRKSLLVVCQNSIKLNYFSSEQEKTVYRFNFDAIKCHGFSDMPFSDVIMRYSMWWNNSLKKKDLIKSDLFLLFMHAIYPFKFDWLTLHTNSDEMCCKDLFPKKPQMILYVIGSWIVLLKKIKNLFLFCVYCREWLIGIGFGLLENLVFHTDFIDGGNRMIHSWRFLR
jgi:hypothetical protein